MTLQNEREFARVTREKLMGVSSSAQSMNGGAPTSMSSDQVNQMGGTSSNMGGSAAPASGKYGGFGSQDIAKLGYNQQGKFDAPYDPYTQGQSAPSLNTHNYNNANLGAQTASASTKKDKNEKKKKSKKSKKSKKGKKKAKDSYDSETDSDDSDDSDSSDLSSDSEEKKKKSKKAKKEVEKAKLGQAPKATRQIAGSEPQQTSTPVQPQVSSQQISNNIPATSQPVPASNPLMDIFDSTPTTPVQ